jgi:hypothetical protein
MARGTDAWFKSRLAFHIFGLLPLALAGSQSERKNDEHHGFRVTVAI